MSSSWPRERFLHRVPRKLKKRAVAAYGQWRWLLCRIYIGQEPLWP